MTTVLEAEKAFLNTQKDEIDILENIYLEELEIIRSTAPLKIRITCRPYLDHSLNPALEQYTVQIDLELPKNYPEAAPIILLDHRLDRITKQEEEKFLNLIKLQANSCLGNQMIFDLVEFVRAWIQDNAVDPKLRPKRIKRTKDNEIEYLMEDDAEPIVNLKKKETYTPVTRDTFLAWKERFDAERRSLRKDDGKKEVKLTGKQLFEANASLMMETDVTKDEDDDDDVDYTAGKQARNNEPEEDKANVFYYDEELYDAELPEDDA